MLEIKKNTLVEELNKVSSLVDRKHTLPILSNVLIHLNKSKLKIIGSNLDIQLKTEIELDKDLNTNSLEELNFATDCKNLNSILKILSPIKPIKLDIKEGENKIKIEHVSGIRNLNIFDTKEFPIASKKTNNLSVFKIKEKTLKESLRKTAFSMATQDIRYYLNGMLFMLEDKQLKMVTTDGHRLSYAISEVDESENNFKTILPRKTVDQLLKLLGDSEDLVTITINDNQAIFEFSTIELITKLIEGKFPDYNKVIPDKNEINIKLEKEEFKNSLIGVSVLMSDKFKGVKIFLKENKLLFTSTNEKKEYSEEELNVEYVGEYFDIGFNVNYLLDFLNNTESDKINMHLNDSNSSALFTVDGDAQYKYVVMPMRI